jgi:hypothetical protein
MYMVITVHSYTELLVYSMVIDIEDSNLTFNLESLLETISATFLKSIKNETEAMGLSRGCNCNLKNSFQYIAKFV